MTGTFYTRHGALNVTGKMAVYLSSSTNVLQIGGATTTPNPCQVTIPTVPSWTPTKAGGTPAFCVSKAKPTAK